MATITTLNANDSGSTSRGVINTNFSNLNADIASLGSSLPFVTVGSGAGFDYVTDGSNDNVQIQQAIDAMAAFDGGSVYFANETFDIGASVVMKSKVCLEGMGIGSELKAKTNLNDDVISGYSDFTYFCRLRNFKINGNKANQSGSGHGINAVFAHTWLMENLHVVDAKTRSINIEGDVSHMTLNNHVHLCRLEDSGATGIHVGAYAPNNHLKNNIIGSTGTFYGIELSNDENIVHGNHIHGTASHGIYVASNYKNNIITDNYCENLASAGTNGIHVDADYNRVANNVCFNWGDYGINILGDRNSVIGNRCFDRQGGKTQEYAIHLGASSNDNTVIGNTTDENLTGRIFDEGSNNYIVGNEGVPNKFGAQTTTMTETDNGNSSTADTIDWRASNKQKSTLTGNCTFTFTAPGGPCSLILKLAQDATGSRTVTWPAAVKWAAGVAPTLTTTASRVDIIAFHYDGTNYFGSSSLNYTV